MCVRWHLVFRIYKSPIFKLRYYQILKILQTHTCLVTLTKQRKLEIRKKKNFEIQNIQEFRKQNRQGELGYKTLKEYIYVEMHDKVKINRNVLDS